MKRIIKLIIIVPYRALKNSYYFVYNFLMLRINAVSFNSMPKINGKLLIVNNGSCHLGDNVIFNSSLESNLVGLYKQSTIAVKKNAKLIIKNDTGFSGVSIFCESSIEIGKFCNFGGNVAIWDTDFHPIDYKLRRKGFESTKTAPIIIGDDVFIGANSIILKGVTIGDRSIIGAGSVVTKNIPNDEIWAGNPIKKIRNIESY
ncbi:acyltransferase [Flavobacterium sp. HTF]|uniref:acyltransferase n=1 Tax=Flavobacterium sp. HTF TaxID=2170732 RepID=UPI000D5F62BD|nr:DapH/DapD/GlmU-related protein [Flavobacterium sp. HTF]PWB24554.1 acyltransferase [Flavobacterium sp. HTF]